MKRVLGLVLALVLVLALLPASVLAADKVVLSPQNLCVDGKMVECEKYNINGYNYFKLRDIAMLVNGTGSQFSVTYDTETRQIIIVTGEAYVPVGGELDLSRGDMSAKAAPSVQKLIINGEERSDLSAYNIGDVNFLKFKDLGAVMGFATNFEQETNTAIIVTRQASEPVDWLIQEYTNTANNGEYSRSVNRYDAQGHILSYTYETAYGRETTEYAYNELGQMTESRYTDDYGGEVNTTVTTREYNLRGQLEKVTVDYGLDALDVTTYSYDDRGNNTGMIYQTNAYQISTVYFYDGNDQLIRQEVTYDDGSTSATEYTRDADGNILTQKDYNMDGALGYLTEYTYKNGDVVREVYTNVLEGYSYTYEYTYEYDEAGNCTLYRSSSDYGGTETLYSYDDQGRMVKYLESGNGYSDSTTYTYDEAGNLLRTETLYTGDYYEEDGERYVTEYTYDAEGSILTETYSGPYSVSETVYTYDKAAGKRSVVCTTTYSPAEGIELGDTELILAAGDEYWLYAYFYPYGAPREEIAWSSGDPAVAEVDQEGKITAAAPGTAVITAVSESGLTAQCTVTVTAEKYVVTADKAAVAVRKGGTVTLVCTLSVNGSWQSGSLSARGYDTDVISLRFDNPESWYDTIDLYITGIETGTSNIYIYPTRDDVVAGEAFVVTVTVVN